MAHVLIMPRLGSAVGSCALNEWKAEEGAQVEADQVLCEVETAKASFEIPAGASGTLLKILRPAGAEVPALEPIAVIGRPGEDWRPALAAAQAASTR